MKISLAKLIDEEKQRTFNVELRISHDQGKPKILKNSR